METTGAIAKIQQAMDGQLTVSPQHLDTSRMDRLMSLSVMTDSECDELRSIALAMPAEHILVNSRELAKHLQYIEATLPSKNIEEQSGQMRTAVYARLLGGYTNAALSYMSQRVCSELDWFPTPHQCLAILADYQPPATRKDKALAICSQHNQVQFEKFIELLRNKKPVELEGKPKRWLHIATERGYLRYEDGEYVRRVAK